MFLRLFFAAFFLVGLAACTRAPSIPEWRAETPNPIHRIVLDEKLSAKDIRQIFQALNTNGRLDALRPWILDPSQSQLDEAASAISKIVYEPALDQNSFVSHVRRRNENRAFSSWYRDLESFSRKPYGKSVFEVVNRIAANKTVPALARRDAAWASTRTFDLFTEMQRLYTDKYEGDPLLESDPAPDALTMGLEITTILQNQAAQLSLSRLAPRLEKARFFERLFSTFAKAQSDSGTDFAHGMASRLYQLSFPKKQTKKPEELTPFETRTKDNNQLALIFQLTRSLNGEANGLFTTLAAGIHIDPAFLAAKHELFDDNLIKSLRGALRSRLRTKTDPVFWKNLVPNPKSAPPAVHPTKEFKELYEIIRDSFQVVFGQATTATTSSTFVLDNAALFFNSLAITRLFQAVVPVWLEKYPGPVDDEFWNVARGQEAPISVAFDEVTAAGRRWTEQTKRELTLFPKDFQDTVDALLTKDMGLGSFQYEFDVADTDRNLKTFLDDNLTIVQKRRPFGDPGLFFRVLLERFTGEDEDTFRIQDLEKAGNLFDVLHQKILQPFSLDLFRKLKTFVFEDFQLASLPDSLAKKILNWLGHNREYTQRFDSFRESSYILKLLDEHEDPEDLRMTPFEVYHRFLQDLPPSAIPDLRDLLAWVDEAKLFEPGSPAAFRYSTIQHLIRDAKGLSRGLFKIAALGESDRRFLAELLDKSLWENQSGVVGSDAHWSLLLSTLSIAPTATAFTILAWLEGNIRLRDLLGELTPGERSWLVEFLQGKDFPELWNFFNHHGTRVKARKLINAFIDLQKTGDLRESLELFAYIKDERMQRIAHVLRDWEASGEMTALLNSLLLILN